MLVIFVLALGVRLGVVIATGGYVPRHDDRDYDRRGGSPLVRSAFKPLHDGERDGHLDQRHRLRPAMVNVHRLLGMHVGVLARLLELLGLLLDVLLLFAVALGFGLVALGDVAARQRHGELGQVLLVALGLVVVPLIRRLGLLDGRFVLEEQRIVLRRAALVAEERAQRGQDRRRHRQLAGEVVSVLRPVLELVLVRPVNVKSFRHVIAPLCVDT